MYVYGKVYLFKPTETCRYMSGFHGSIACTSKNLKQSKVSCYYAYFNK